jgi:hypothetical protein
MGRHLLRRLTITFALGAVVLGSACQPTVPKVSVPVSKPATTYRIALTNGDGSAVRWNPCQPIPYVLNTQGAPSFAAAELSRAIAAIESASGLDLVSLGTTTERPAERQLQNPRYGSGYSPILITFASATEVPFGSPTASGWGQAVPVVEPSTGNRQYATGQVVLRPGGWTEGTSSANPLSLMLRHELGHVLGLSHVAVTTEIMGTGGNGTARAWGPGDKVGLTKVGKAAGCLPVI